MGEPVDGIAVGGVFAGLRIDAVAGTGGMGTVYRAHDLALERTVAVKIIRPSLSADPEFQARFRREARLAASLEHPHVVPVLHGGTEQGRLYLTMRFVDGTDLLEHLRRGGPLGPDEVVQVLRQVGSALDTAHRFGLVHRDVKPANILLRRPQERYREPFHCYLTDFGISRRIAGSEAAAITSTGIALGTVDYMAPEQLLGHPLDGRADQYALACVAYHLLTGVAPFQGTGGIAKAAQHVSAAAPDVRSRRPQVPAALAQALLRAMSKRPGDRFADCAALASTAAGPAAAGGSGAGPVVGARSGAASGATRAPTEIARTVAAPSGPRRRTLLIGGGAGLLTAGAIAVGAVALARRPDDRTGIAATGSTGPTGSTTSLGPVVATAAGAPISLGAAPSRAQVHEGGVWLTCPEAGQVIRVDAANRGVQTFTVDGGPTDVAFAGGRAWVWNYSSALTPVDLGTGRVGAFVRTEKTLGGVASGGGKVWFLVPSEGALGSLDPATARVDDDLIQVGARPRGLVVADGVVHVVVAGSSQVVRVEESSRRVLEPALSLPSGVTGITATGPRVYVGGTAGLALLDGTDVTPGELRWPQVGIVVAGEDALWAFERTGHRLRKLSVDLTRELGAPATGLPEDITDLALTPGSIWAADQNGQRLLQLRTT